MRMQKFEGVIVSKYKDDALFYKLKTKLPLSTILRLKLCNRETEAEARDHYQLEEHWLADWEFASQDLFDTFVEGEEIVVTYESASTRYHSNARHYHKPIGPIRNINAYRINRKEGA